MAQWTQVNCNTTALVTNRVTFLLSIEIQKKAKEMKKSRRAANYCTSIKMTNRARFSCFAKWYCFYAYATRVQWVENSQVTNRNKNTIFYATIGNFYFWNGFFQNVIINRVHQRHTHTNTIDCSYCSLCGDNYFLISIHNLCNFIVIIAYRWCRAQIACFRSYTKRAKTNVSIGNCKKASNSATVVFQTWARLLVTNCFYDLFSCTFPSLLLLVTTIVPGVLHLINFIWLRLCWQWNTLPFWFHSIPSIVTKYSKANASV